MTLVVNTPSGSSSPARQPPSLAQPQLRKCIVQVHLLRHHVLQSSVDILFDLVTAPAPAVVVDGGSIGVCEGIVGLRALVERGHNDHIHDGPPANTHRAQGLVHLEKPCAKHKLDSCISEAKLPGDLGPQIMHPVLSDSQGP
eukprot:UN0955